MVWILLAAPAWGTCSGLVSGCSAIEVWDVWALGLNRVSCRPVGFEGVLPFRMVHSIPEPQASSPNFEPAVVGVPLARICRARWDAEPCRSARRRLRSAEGVLPFSVLLIVAAFHAVPIVPLFHEQREGGKGGRLRVLHLQLSSQAIFDEALRLGSEKAI